MTSCGVWLAVGEYALQTLQLALILGVSLKISRWHFPSEDEQAVSLGPTTYYWVPRVLRVVEHLAREFPHSRPNTYIAHPWPGWSAWSVDFWGAGGRGDPIPEQMGWHLLQEAFTLGWGPPLRHTIYLHQLWTDFGGYSYWRKDDHSGALRHVHLTYWKT